MNFIDGEVEFKKHKKFSFIKYYMIYILWCGDVPLKTPVFII